jgi:hypothetical protein
MNVMKKNKKLGKGSSSLAEKKNSKRRKTVITSGWVSPRLNSRIAL